MAPQDTAAPATTPTAADNVARPNLGGEREVSLLCSQWIVMTIIETFFAGSKFYEPARKGIRAGFGAVKVEGSSGHGQGQCVRKIPSSAKATACLPRLSAPGRSE